MKKLKKSHIFVAVLVTVVVTGGGFFARWANTPASTVGSQVDGSVLASKITLTDLDTHYFSTSIPDYYLIKSQLENKQNNTLGRYLLTSKDVHQSDQVGITIGPAAGSINSVSAVQLRSTYPDLYKRIQVAQIPEDAVAFSKTSDYEKTVAWQRQGKYVVISVSGSNQRQAELDQTLEAILANWRWVNIQ